MLQVQKFIEDNKYALREVRNLEMIRIKQPNTTVSVRQDTRRKYTDLLDSFESSFPQIPTTMHFLYWAFIRARIANTYLESSEPAKAYEYLKVIFSDTKDLVSVRMLAEKIESSDETNTKKSVFNNSDVILLNTFAGLFQTIYNLLAASVSATTTTTLQTNKSLMGQKEAGSSFHWLHCAKRVHYLYAQYNNPFDGPTFWETIAFKEVLFGLGDFTDTSAHTREAKKSPSPERLLFEHGYTNTLFLMAQAYQLYEEPNHAATCCQLTLSRQLTFAQPFRELAVLAEGPTINNRIRPRASSARRSLEANHAVYGNMRRRFACYISAVIQSFDPIEWAGNAWSLGNYFITVEDASGYYYTTLECFISAYAVLNGIGTQNLAISLSTMNMNDKRLNQQHKMHAQICQSLAKLGLKLMKKGADCVRESPHLLHQKSTGVISDQARDFGSMFQLNLTQALRRVMYDSTTKSPLASNDLGDGAMPNPVPSTASGTPSPGSPTASMTRSSEFLVDPLATCPTTYEAAAAQFRLISQCLIDAERSYFTLQDHCTEVIEMTQMHSNLYKLMSHFELVEARQCCMHKRRIDIMEKVLDQLSKKHYLHACRELLFEVADAMCTLRESKQRTYDETRDSDPTKSLYYAKKVNALAKRALKRYQEFIQTYARPTESNHTVAEEDIRPLVLDALNVTAVVVGLYGSPYDKSTWEPEPMSITLSSADHPPWEFSAIIYDVIFFILLTALLAGQALLLVREARKAINFIVNRFILGRKKADYHLEDWNQIHINKYTPFQVDYVKGSTEEYRLHTEDYQELLRVLNFISERSGS